MKSAAALFFALVATPLAAQDRADLPDHPAPALAGGAPPASPLAAQRLDFLAKPKAATGLINDLFGGAAAFVHDHAHQRAAGFGASLHQDITEQLSVHIGEIRMPRTGGQPSLHGLGGGFVFRLKKAP